jgi:hypothetical protein
MHSMHSQGAGRKPECDAGPHARPRRVGDAADNLTLAGPIGTGKTHLTIALGVEATKQKWRLSTLDVLIIDELGSCPPTTSAGELLFNLVTDRYERRATVVATNLAFAEWVAVFAGDEKVTTALLDRLAHHATVVTTQGERYRMRRVRTFSHTIPTSARSADLGVCCCAGPEGRRRSKRSNVKEMSWCP